MAAVWKKYFKPVEQDMFKSFRHCTIREKKINPFQNNATITIPFERKSDEIVLRELSSESTSPSAIRQLKIKDEPHAFSLTQTDQVIDLLNNKNILLNTLKHHNIFTDDDAKKFEKIFVFVSKTERNANIHEYMKLFRLLCKNKIFEEFSRPIAHFHFKSSSPILRYANGRNVIERDRLSIMIYNGRPNDRYHIFKTLPVHLRKSKVYF